MSSSKSSGGLEGVVRVMKKLQGSENWTTWRRQLKEEFEMQDLWEPITDRILEPDKSDTKRFAAWMSLQRKMRGVLFAITGELPRALLERNEEKTAIDLYYILKDEYDFNTWPTYDELHLKIAYDTQANHKNLGAYIDEFLKNCGRLQKLGETFTEKQLTSFFLHGLDESYRAWKHTVTAIYIKDPVEYVRNSKGETTKVTNFPKVETLIAELKNLDHQSKTWDPRSSPRAFNAKGKNPAIGLSKLLLH